MQWEWSDDLATVEASSRNLGGGYAARIAPVEGNPRARTITLTREGRTVYSWEGHGGSAFVRDGGVLYYADFTPLAPGCAIVAYDLEGGKVLWRTGVHGVPVVAHSKYGNRVNLKVDGGLLAVYGYESFGRYVDLLDVRTGRVVGHRVYPANVRPPGGGSHATGLVR